jgi:glutathionylspermidine amidase/synthetase
MLSYQWNRISRRSRPNLKRYNKKKSIISFRTQVGNGKDQCATTFGTHIGYVDGVPAYSNCIDKIKSDFDNIISYNGKNVVSGTQWQCVEYARRYLITKLGVKFGSVKGAEDVFALTTVESIETGKKYKFKSFKNGSKCKNEDEPKVNDVIIWARNNEDTPYGHIAVILKIDDYQIFIGEQNWNDVWISPSYSRILTLNKNNNKCSIEDENYTILGWKRVIID